MIDQEGKIGLAEAAKLFPTGDGVHIHPATLTRWIHRGVRLRDGTIVRLEASRIGYRFHTSREAVARFLAALNPASAPTSPTRTPQTRRAAAEAAGRRLEAVGA